MNSRTFACAACRVTAKRAWLLNAVAPACPSCRAPMTDMGTRWRAPTKGGVKAWEMVARGEHLWDRKAKTPRWGRAQTWRGLYWTRPPGMDGLREGKLPGPVVPPG